MTDTIGLPLFDAQRSRDERDDGLVQAASPPSRQLMIQEAKTAAIMLACLMDGITADDVSKHFAGKGINISAVLGHAMGTIFRPPKVWEWTGEIRNSERVGRRASALRVWRLRA